MRYLAVVLAIVASLSACASGGSGGGTSEPRPQRLLITAEELAAARVGTVYEAIEHLRSFWFTPLPPTSSQQMTPRLPVVFLDNSELGDLEVLWTIAVTDAKEIRYLEPAQSVMRYGGQYTDGIIQVITH